MFHIIICWTGQANGCGSKLGPLQLICNRWKDIDFESLELNKN